MLYPFQQKTALCNNFCVVFLSVIVAWDNFIPQWSLKSYAVTSVWCSEIWTFLRYGTSEVPISCSLFLTSIVTSFVTFIDSILLLKNSYKKNSSSSSLCGWDATIALMYRTSPTPSTNDGEHFGKIIVGYQVYSELRLICGHSHSYLSEDVCVCVCMCMCVIK